MATLCTRCQERRPPKGGTFCPPCRQTLAERPRTYVRKTPYVRGPYAKHNPLRCGACDEAGHNVRTCHKAPEDRVQGQCIWCCGPLKKRVGLYCSKQCEREDQLSGGKTAREDTR